MEETIDDERHFLQKNSVKLTKNSRGTNWEWKLIEGVDKAIIDSLVEMGEYAQQQSFIKFSENN